MPRDLKQDVHFLTELLAQVIREQEGEGLLLRIEEIRTLAKEIRRADNPLLVESQKKLIQSLKPREAYQLARAFTIYFQLLNIAEEAQRVRRLRDYDRDPDAMPEMSLRKLFKDLSDEGLKPKDIASFLSGASIEPVLTAHPTEAKRRTVLDHLFFISNQLIQLDRDDLTVLERDRVAAHIHEALEILWQTSEIRSRKVEVLDEVDQTLYYFERTIIDLVANIHQTVAWDLGLEAKDIEPFIHFGSWVGADRDGNPNVTPSVTWTTAQRQRRVIVRFYLSAIEGFIRKFSHSLQYADVSKKLLESIERDKLILPESARELERYETSEIYRKKFSFMHRRLELVLEEKKGAYPNAQAFVDDLMVVRDSLLTHCGKWAANGDLEQLIIQARSFGFHLAVLDFRDHAGKIRAALADPSSVQGKDIAEQFKVFKKLKEKFDSSIVDNYILSMTETPDDLMAVFRLAKKEGLIRVQGNKVTHATMGIVPLFETIQALEHAHEVMEGVFTQPVYRSYLKARGDVQEIMLGYSDSSKDGGYVAANWHLYLAQKNLYKMAHKYGVEVKFFHGKGGTIDRGGGQSHQAILGQPFAAAGGRIKLTEQGEVVAQKYANAFVARRNLEQLISAVALTNLAAGKDAGKVPAQWETCMATLAADAFHFYRKLVFETPGFLDFYHEATPIGVLKITKIGSRPAARGSQRSFDQLRAIPWVFSWVQSRYIISAWYGTGHALKKYIDEGGAPAVEELRRLYKQWPFFRSLIDNVQVSLAKTDLYIAQLYADLVEDEALRRTVHEAISEEYHRAVDAVLLISEQKEILGFQKVLRESIRLRNPYVDPLNYMQVRFLREQKDLAHAQGRDEARAAVDEILLLTVNGIASGMKSTG